MSKVKQLMDQKGWDVRDLSYHSRASLGACYQAMQPDWPQNGTNWKTIKRIAAALGVSTTTLTADNNKGAPP